MSGTNPEKFLIVCNGRTGSTWLETMLGCLPEVAVDYELKWNPIGYELLPHLKVIPNQASCCGDILRGLSDQHPVVGSKLVLDKRSYSPSEFSDLHQAIDHDIRIIHLVRDYYEIVLSWYRGVYHILNENASNGESEANSEIYKSIAKGDSRKDFNLLEKASYVMRLLKQFTQTRDPLPIMQLLNRHGFANFDTSDREIQKFKIDLEHCLANDRWAQTLHQSNKDYCVVRYSEIPKAFPSLVKFIGSNAPDSLVHEILENPISKKLPPKEPKLLCSSPDRLKEMCNEFNHRRDLALDI